MLRASLLLTLLNPLWGPVSGPLLAAPLQQITWIDGDLDAAQVAVAGGKQGVMIYFWMQGSAFCDQMNEQTLADPAAAARLDPWACVSAAVGSEKGGPLLGRFGVTTLPTMLFLTAEGEPDDAILGFLSASSLTAELDRIEAGTGTVRDLRARALATPDDFGMRQRLAVKLADVGRAEESAGVIESIRADDPEGRSPVAARIFLQDVLDEVSGQADPSDPSTWDLARIEAHVRRVRPAEVAFEGWELLGRLRVQRGERREAFDAWRQARRHVPDARLFEFVAQLVETAWTEPGELRGRDEKLVLEAAKALVADLEAAQEEADGTAQDPEAVPPPPAEGEEEGPQLVVALDMLAQAYALNGKEREALDALDRALELDPGNAALQSRRTEIEGR